MKNALRIAVDVLERLTDAIVKAMGIVFGVAFTLILIDSSGIRAAYVLALFAVLVVTCAVGRRPDTADVTMRLPDTDEARAATADLNRAIARVNELARITAVKPTVATEDLS